MSTGFSGVVGWNFGWLVLSFCFVLDLFTLFFVSECFAYVHHVCAWCHWKSEEGFRFPESKSQMVVSHCVGARNRTRGPCSGNKRSSAFDSLFYGDFFFFFENFLKNLKEGLT